MGEILYRRQLIQINICFVHTLTRSCVSFCIFTMAGSSVSTVAGVRMPTLEDGANANIWGGDELMSVSVFNVNYSQTRTSLCIVALPIIPTACMPFAAQLCILCRI